MTDVFKQAASSRSIFVELVDSTTGLPKTGIADTAVTAYYTRTLAAPVLISVTAAATVSTAFTAGRWFEASATNAPGVYRLDITDAAFATGVPEVVVTVKATGCRTVSRLFDLVDINNQVAYAPNVAAAGIGGLLTAPTTANTGLADVTRLLGTAWLPPAVAGTPDVNAKQFGGAPVTATTSITIPAASTLATTAGAVASVTGAVGSIAPGGIAAASFAAGAIDAAAIATDAIGSAEISLAAVAKIQVGLATPTNITAGTITTVTTLTGHTPQTGDSFALLGKRIMIETTIATLAGQTSFTLTAGTGENGAYGNRSIMFIDSATPTQRSYGKIISYTGATKTVSLLAAPSFTIAVGDTVVIFSDQVAVTEADISAVISQDIDTGAYSWPAAFVDMNAALAAQITALNNITAASVVAAMGTGTFLTALASAANLLIVSDGVGYMTSAILGTISDAGTAGETYVVTFGGATYTLDYTGLDATGNRTGVTRAKT